MIRKHGSTAHKNNPYIGKDVSAEQKQEKDKTELFEFVPFNDENIAKFTDYINYLEFTKSRIKPEAFYKKNAEGETFIDVLLSLEKPQSLEEVYIRTYLLNIFKDKLPIVNDQKETISIDNFNSYFNQ